VSTFSTSFYFDNLKTKVIGRDIEVLKTVLSTTSYLLDKDVPIGKVIVAENQSRGKGRLNRNWVNFEDSLLFSVSLPIIRNQYVSQLNILIGYTLLDVLNPLIINAKIKWPNDIIINNKKIAGININVKYTGDTLEKIVVGIGINIAGKPETDQVDNIATTMSDHTVRPIYKDLILASFMNLLEQNIEKLITRQMDVKLLWKDYTVNKGKDITVTTAQGTNTYKEFGINSSGYLVVIDSTKSLKTIPCGDVGYDFSS